MLKGGPRDTSFRQASNTAELKLQAPTPLSQERKSVPIEYEALVAPTVWTYEEETSAEPVGIPTSNHQARSIFTVLNELSRFFNVKCAVYITGYGCGLEHTETEKGPVPYFCEHHKRETISYALRLT